MTINGKVFRPMIGADELQDIVGRLASEISRDYSHADLVVCPILTGAFMFAADLVRRLTVPCEVCFVRYTSYSGMTSTGQVQCQLPFPPSVAGRDVLIVEDVVDTGFSLAHVLRELQALGPRSIKLCSLLYKPDAFRGDFTVDYVGHHIGNEFIVGYGLDYDEQGRNLPEIMVIDE